MSSKDMLKLRKSCDLTKTHQAEMHVAHHQEALSQPITTQIPPPPSSQILRGQSMSHEMSVKDGIVIAFMLGLWMYSIFLMFRAWSKMLNFSDDQAPKGNKGALLWKYVMDHIVNSRKERRKSILNRKLLRRLTSKGEGSVSGEDLPEDSNSLKLDYMQNEEDLQEVVVVHTNENEPNDIVSEITQNPIVNLTQPCSESEELPQIHNFNPHYYCPPSTEVVSSGCETSSPSSSLVDPQKRPVAAALRPLPTTSSSPSSLKRLPHQVKSLGQTEFKAMALNSDLTQVQEKLAALDHFGGSFDKNDLSEMDSSTRSDPPEPPPKDYFEEAV